MSCEANKEIIRLLDSALWDRERGLQRMEPHRPPGGTAFHVPTGWPIPRGRDQARPDQAAARSGSLLDAFPDLHVVAEETILVAEGDLVARRLTGEGTHMGAYVDPIFGTFPPTGKTVRWNAVNIYRIVDGKIVDNWAHVDVVGLVRQLGWRGPGEETPVADHVTPPSE
jgi:hypothetical protein